MSRPRVGKTDVVRVADVVDVVSPSLALAAVATCKGINDPGELRAALERARVVAVLDGWAAQQSHRRWHLVNYAHGVAVSRWVVNLTWPAGETERSGPTPDAARAAAARAIEAGEV